MKKELIINQLQEAQQLAGGSRWHRFSRLGYRYARAMVYRYLWYPLTHQSVNLQTETFFGCPMVVSLPAGMDLFLLGCKSHDSEIRLAKYLLLNVRPGQVFVDVGAHFGYFSLLAAMLTESTGKVLAFEPARRNFPILQANAHAFNNIICFNQLVCDTNDLCDFLEFPVIYSEYNTMHQESVPKGLHYEKVSIQGVRLDDVLHRTASHPDWIKIDVEGAEPEVIKGLESTLSGNKPPVIAMEYLSGRNHAHQEAVALLRAKGYLVYYPDNDGQLVVCEDCEKYMSDHKLDSENLIFLHP
jgi:FkbM family methyltransferase